ncbi:MAG TPA: hypothetical protein VGY90_05370 [Steroidobacteraceae bacterium]|jgi:hypothetical protein|nr:hypothetical protein [Steroidobacteraceae bacterium]
MRLESDVLYQPAVALIKLKASLDDLAATLEQAQTLKEISA